MAEPGGVIGTILGWGAGVVGIGVNRGVSPPGGGVKGREGGRTGVGAVERAGGSVGAGAWFGVGRGAGVIVAAGGGGDGAGAEFGPAIVTGAGAGAR